MIPSRNEGIVITLDPKKRRLRIYKSVLHQLGDPSYIQLLVNPEQQIIAVRALPREESIRCSIRISRYLTEGGEDVEVYSRMLLSMIMELLPDNAESCSYNIYGSVIHSDKLAAFPLSSLTPILNEEMEVLQS